MNTSPKFSPKVSVVMITYNHGKYIETAIKGVLAQKCNFDFELIIGDDCSTDGTTNVIIDFYKKYPHIITPNIHKENLGPHANFKSTYKKATAEYIAICEGDDYWTDALKLQKQIDFLEANSDFVMCSHAVETTFEGGVEETNPFVEPIEKATFYDLLESHTLPTLSLVFRNGIINEFPEWLENVLCGDAALELILAHHGKNYHINEVMGIHLKHPGGITQTPEWKQNRTKDKLCLYQNLNKHLNCEHEDVLNPKIVELLLRMGILELKKGNMLRSLTYLSKGFLKSPLRFSQKSIKTIATAIIRNIN